MIRPRYAKAAALALLSALTAVTAACARPAASSDAALSIGPYEAETIATGLSVPWQIDAAPDGRLFVTERTGALRVIEHGKLRAAPVATMEAPFVAVGEGGLLGVAVDPRFTANHYLYLYYTYQEKDGTTRNKVVRYKESGGRAAPDRTLLTGIPGSVNHNGGRIKFGPDNLLYITAGEMYDPPIAQDVNSLGGKILRITPDGAIPPDNPFPGSPVYSYGHRNPQGLAWHPETKQLFASEHGQTAHDEINMIVKGGNYGWPVIQGDQTAPKIITPLIHSGTETWAPSGMTFITGGAWKNDLLVANLKGTQILRVKLNAAGRASLEQPLFKGKLGRLRDVYEAPDGSLYILTNNRDGRGQPGPEDDRIIRLKPKKPA